DDGDEAGCTVAAAVFPLVLIDPQDPDAGQMGGVAVNQLTGLVQGDLVDGVPSDVQRLRDRGHAHPVDRQALEYPPGAPQGHLLFRWRAVESLLEDPRSALRVRAGEPGQAYPQAGGVAYDR